MKKTLAKLRHYAIEDAVKKILMIIAPLAIINVLLAVLGGHYLSRNVGAFLDKPNAAILSDLFFLEGTVVFAAGAFGAFLALKQPKENPSENNESVTEKIHPSIIVMIIGASLIGLSITVGTFFA